MSLYTETPLYEQLQKIFPEIENVYDEAKKKLINSWCLVNGEVHQIFDIPSETSVIVDKNGKKQLIDVETLETWLPQTGLYPLESGEAIFLTKRPIRQWHRSFMYSFYDIHHLTDTSVPKTILSQIAKSKRVNIFVDTLQNIWWWNKIIGFVKNNDTIVCTNKYYKQELLDWSKTE